jgi:glycerate dehydrogenase
MNKIVFLDRDSLVARIRRPEFDHTWIEYPATTAEQVVERLRDATVCITNKVPVSAIDIGRLPKLKMIAVAATGTNTVDLGACRARGIVVSNIRNYSLASVPEHCFTLMLALRRNLRAYCADVEAGLWQESERFCLLGHPIADLAKSRLGIIGYGALGRQVATIGRAFGMQVSVVSRSPVSDPTVNVMTLERLLRTSDVISLHLPLTPDTEGLIGEDELDMMKPTAILINTARGGLVDEAARALQERSIGGAGFDVLETEPPSPANPLLSLRLPNFILTPHVAWASAGAMQILADMLVDNIDAWAAGIPINVVE